MMQHASSPISLREIIAEMLRCTL